MRPVIIGAGIGGLCAASLLSLSGKNPLVLEKESRIGGRATSYPYKGCILDNGWHASYYKDGYVGGYIGEILSKVGRPLKLKKLDPPVSQYRDGKIESIMGFAHVPAELRPFLLKVAVEVRAIPYEQTHEYDDITVLEWAQQKTQNPILLKHFNLSSYFALTAKADRASAGEFFRVLQIATSICSGLGYPLEGGIKTIADALRAGIESRGGEVITEAEVVSMEREGDLLSCITYVKDGDTREVIPSHVLFNPPVYFITDYITDFPSEFTEKVKSLKGHHTGPSTQVYICLDSPVLDTTSLVLLPEDADMWQPGEHCAVFSPSNCSRSVAPPGSQLLLMAVPHARASAEEEAVERLATVFPSVRNHIEWIHSFTTAIVDGLAKHVGFVGNHRTRVTSPLKNLFFVGDTVEGTGPGMELPADSARRCFSLIEGGE